jgi:hypothetical protein
MVRKLHKEMNCFHEVHGEAGGVCGETLADWVAKLSSIVNGFDPNNNGCGDERNCSFMQCQAKLFV